MGRKILLLIAISALAALPVRATIPLVLEQSFQLPPCTSWDVQHWMDSSSFGYAYLRADTVYWAAHVGDAEQTLKLPPDSFFCHFHACDDWMHLSGVSHVRVMILRSSSAPNDPFVVVHSNGRWSDDDGFYGLELHMFLLYDLGTGVMQDSSTIEGDTYDWMLSNGEYQTSELGYFILWPPPPDESTYFVFAQNFTGFLDGVGYDYNWESGHIFLSSISDFSLRAVCEGRVVCPFARVASPRFAVFSHTYMDVSYPADPPDHTEHREIRTYPPSPPGFPPLVDGNLSCVRAQSDGNGTQRLIANYGDGTRALNPDTYDTLWYVPQYLGGAVARLAGSADERILQGNAVYDASNGAYLDLLAPILGPRYIIRQPNRNSEFVAYEDATWTVRVYTTIDIPKNLTCTYIPGTETVRLRWQEAPRATRYLIYVSSSATVPPWPLASVPAGMLTYDAEISQDRSFYQVTAEYDH